jgi:hypothetical protein
VRSLGSAQESELERERPAKAKEGGGRTRTAPETAGKQVVPGFTEEMLVAVQQGSGNLALGRMLGETGRRERPPRAGPSQGGGRGLIQRDAPGMLPGLMTQMQLAGMNQQQKLDRLRELLKSGSGADIAAVWESFGGSAYEVAKANPDLFKSSIDKAGSALTDVQAFKVIETKFKGDVETLALSYLDSNRAGVMAEMDKLGAHGNDDADKNPTADQQQELHEVQKWAKLLADCQKAEEGMLEVPVGYEPNEPGNVRGKFVVATFQPDSPPQYAQLPSDAQLSREAQGAATKIKSWDEVKKNWEDVAMLKSVCEQKSPALMMMGEGNSKSTGETAGADLATARKQIGQGLKALTERIEKAVPMVGSKIDYEDLVPIHQQLFSGQKGASGQNWADPVEQAVAKQLVKNADSGRLLVSLGLGALSAAAFILAPFTGGATLAALLIVGVGATAANAAMSWDRYLKLEAGAEATAGTSRFAIISKEQADSALVTAIIDTAFVLIDMVGAAKAFKAAAAARELMAAGEAGAKAAAEQSLKNLSKGAAGAAAVEKAVLELGPQEASRISGKSFKELSEIVGNTEAGAKLAKLAELGPEAAAKGAHDALEALKDLGKLAQPEADKAVLQAIDSLGYVGTLKQGGGWKAITKVVGEGSGSATKLEAWRKQLLEEMQAFLEQEEKDAASKAVRTGTEKATSDMDVQAVGGAAALNAEKAQQWLAARIGVGKDELKNMLDATIFVDPFRAHLYDVAKGLTDADRGAIAASQAGVEKRLIFGARLTEAQAKGDEKLAKQIIEEAAGHGVGDLKAFKPLTEAEQTALSREIDGMIKELQTTTDPARKAALTKSIGEKQALINASHPEAYLGGGVRIQVTGRPGDVEKFDKLFEQEGAKGLGTGTETSAQRVIAVLSEGKFFDEAIATLRKPGADTIEVAGALKDLGKHGARACEVAGRGGHATEELIEIGTRMDLLSKAAKRPDFVKSLGDAAQMDKLVEHATGLLEQAKAEVETAVKELEKTAKVTEISAEELDKLRAWTSFQLKYAQAAQAVNATLPASLEAFHQLIRDLEKGDTAGDDKDKPNKSNQATPPPPSSPDGGTAAWHPPMAAPDPEDGKPPDGQPGPQPADQPAPATQ